MPVFDEQLLCQFGFVLSPEFTDLPIGKLADFSSEFERELEISDHSIDLDFGEPQIGQTFVVNTGDTIQTAIWTSEGDAAPKLTLSPERFDLYLDILEIEDTIEEAFDLSLIAEEIGDSMLGGLGRLDARTNRLVCIIKCAGSEAQNSNALQIVADQFFNEEIQGSVESYRDLRGRTNRIEEWELGPLLEGNTETEDEEITVHIIHDANANWVLQDHQPETRIEWNIDLNTTPEVPDDAGYREEKIRYFFDKALDTASRELRELRD